MCSEASSVFSFVGASHPSLGQIQELVTEVPPPEIESLVLSLKLMVSAGTVCAFLVGGGVDEETVPEVPGWTYFIGDRFVVGKESCHQLRCFSY